MSDFELVDVDPATLVIGANVRTDTHPDAKEFARSIRERGVLEVITAHRNDDGALVVLRGQRRSVVATEVGTPSGTVPVRVVPAPDEADRIIDQLVENHHREGIHASEVVGAVEQLSLVGLSAAQIAKRTQVGRTDVDAALSVAETPTVRERVANEPLSLDDAAMLAEFDGDEEATARLAQAIEFGRPLEHVAQRIRDERAEQAEILAEVERLRGEGLPVLNPDEMPENVWNLAAHCFVDAEGNVMDDAALDGRDGVAVVVDSLWEYPEDDEEPEASRVLAPRWIVTDAEAAGVQRRWGRTDDPGDAAEPTDEEKDAAKAERRRVVANNKAWRSAETVRRDWLRSFVARKTTPKGAEALICEAVLTGEHSLLKGMESLHPMLRTLLDVGSDKSRWDSGDDIAKIVQTANGPKTATMTVLAAVVAAWEDRTDTHTWRNPSAWDARVLGALVEWGYKPSEVERIVLGEESTEEDAA